MDLLTERVGGTGISCKELPAYQFPPVAKMQLILRQLRGIISSEPWRVVRFVEGMLGRPLAVGRWLRWRATRAEPAPAASFQRACLRACCLPLPSPLPLCPCTPVCPAVSTPEPSNWNIFQPDNRNLVPGLDLPPIVFVAMSNDTYGAQQAPVHAVLLRRNGIPATSVTVRGRWAAAGLHMPGWAVRGTLTTVSRASCSIAGCTGALPHFLTATTLPHLLTAATLSPPTPACRPTRSR